MFFNLFSFQNYWIGSEGQRKDHIQDQERDSDRIILVDCDVLKIRDRDQTRLDDKNTLSEGTVVNPDGTCIKDKDRQVTFTRWFLLRCRWHIIQR